MADVIRTALGRLLPEGLASRYTGQAALLLDALSISLGRPKEYLRAVQDEASPLTATATIDEWLLLLGITAPVVATLGEKRAVAYSAWTAIGGQSLDYINTQVRLAYPNAFIRENEIDEELRMGEAEMGELECESVVLTQLLYYIVAGYVDYARERLTLQGLLRHLAPAHLVELFQARVKFDGDVARCNIATTGRSICGRSVTAYVPTEQTIGRCAVGRCGVAITGRTS